jgi:GMP synthase-like glutamine amidotransferase
LPAVAIIENSEGLGRFFADHLDDVAHDIFPVWRDQDFPEDTYDAYILTGDYNNISDGLLPFHRMEIEFVKSISGRKIFASCFAHQLIAHHHRGKVGKRTERFIGWHPVIIKNDHPVFEGLETPFFLSLNGDEVKETPAGTKILATNPDCTHEMLLYGDSILTCQAHPEILKDDALEIIEKHRARLSVRCPDLDGSISKTERFADDEASRTFMGNVVRWLLS